MKNRKEKERKLTSEEQRRVERFALLSKQMEDNGYERQDCIISALKANLYAIIIMLPFAILSKLIFSTTGLTNTEYESVNILLVLVLFLISIVVHEAIHGLTWSIFAKDHLKSIEFGVIWKYLTPYCTCSAPLSKAHYILGAIMPTLILGFGLSALSCIFRSPLLQALSVLLIFSGGGDFLILLKLLRVPTKGKTVLVCDHPYECGFIIFAKPFFPAREEEIENGNFSLSEK